MDKGKKTLLIIAGVIGVLLLGTITYFYNINRIERYDKPKVTPISENETNPEVWGKYYPRQYESYLEAGSGKIYETKYGGNDQRNKLEQFPEMKTLFAGYGFAEEYFDDRGHPYAVEDVGTITEKRTKAGATCLTCKSPEIPGLLEKFGDDFYSMDFYETKDKYIKHSISCADCHDPQTMDLRITRPALREALAKMGINVDKATRQEMRTYVCAQCHVEYYFTPDKKVVTFPWGDSVEGMKPDKVYEYYQSGEFKDKPFVDWEHAISGTPMLKAQHPDFELFMNSTHQAAGVSCADCHMQFIKEGNVKITNHNIRSPLTSISESCQVCHRQSEEYLRKRVEHIQDNNYNLLKLAAERCVEAVQEIEKSQKIPEVDQKLLNEAREYHRKAQWFWDWMAAENSMGFHNPQEGLNYIGRSIDYAHKAINAAQRARGEIPSQ